MLEGPGNINRRHEQTLAMMKPRFPVTDDVRKYFKHCLEVADMSDCTDNYRCVSEIDESLELISSVSVKILYDRETGKHKLMREATSKVTGNRTIFHIIPREGKHLAKWLGEMIYGKTRLWYIIREWNERYCAPKFPKLPLDTPLNKLI